MSSYSPNLALYMMDDGTTGWGPSNNLNIGTLLEQAVSGYVTQAMPDTDVNLTMAPGADCTARNMVIECTGALTANRTLTVPNNRKLYLIYNNTTNGGSGLKSVNVKINAQSGPILAVPNGKKMLFYSDSTGIVEAHTYFNSFSASGVNSTPIGNVTPSTGVFTTVTVNSLTASPTAGVTGAIINAASGTLALDISTPSVSGGSFLLRYATAPGFGSNSGPFVAKEGSGNIFSHGYNGQGWVVHDEVNNVNFFLCDFGNQTVSIGAPSGMVVANGLIAKGVPYSKYKAADTSRNTTTTITNDPDLFRALSAGTYEFHLFIQLVGVASNTGMALNVNYSGTFTAGASSWGGYRAFNTGAVGVYSGSAVSSATTTNQMAIATLSTAANIDFLVIKGVLCATGSGTLAFAWAQNTSSGNNSTVKQGSHLMITQIS